MAMRTLFKWILAKSFPGTESRVMPPIIITHVFITLALPTRQENAFPTIFRDFFRNPRLVDDGDDSVSYVITPELNI